MAAGPSYLLFVLPRSKQDQVQAKEGDQSDVVSTWVGNSSFYHRHWNQLQ